MPTLVHLGLRVSTLVQMGLSVVSISLALTDFVSFQTHSSNPLSRVPKPRHFSAAAAYAVMSAFQKVPHFYAALSVRFSRRRLVDNFFVGNCPQVIHVQTAEVAKAPTAGQRICARTTRAWEWHFSQTMLVWDTPANVVLSRQIPTRFLLGGSAATTLWAQPTFVSEEHLPGKAALSIMPVNMMFVSMVSVKKPRDQRVMRAIHIRIAFLI